MIGKTVAFHGLAVKVSYTLPDNSPVRADQVSPPERGEMLIDSASVEDPDEFHDHAYNDADDFPNHEVEEGIQDPKRWLELRPAEMDELWEAVLR